MEANLCRAVLGTFDGVHVGHRALFARAEELSASDGMRVIAIVIDRPGGYLTDLREREKLLLCAGAQRVYVLPLEEVRHMSAEAFTDYIARRFGVGAAVCGYDFRFGRDRQGDALTLSSLLPTEVIPEQRIGGVRVSSSAVRSAIEEGRAEEAALLLGRNYAVSGSVAGGKRLGRTRGYPTANIPYPELRAPMRRGVYFTRVHCGQGAYDAVSNVGVCPTVSGEDTVIESYLLDYSGELYGQEITVEFLHFLRPEQRFDDLDALYRRIALDEAAAEEYFNK